MAIDSVLGAIQKFTYSDPVIDVILLTDTLMGKVEWNICEFF
jgi:hypothetical protein